MKNQKSKPKIILQLGRMRVAEPFSRGPSKERSCPSFCGQGKSPSLASSGKGPSRAADSES